MTRHNVSEPSAERFHRPSTGEYYSPRMISVSSPADATWLAWQRYDPATTLDEVCVQCDSGADEGAVQVISQQPGIHDRPVIVGRSDTSVDVLWVQDCTRLVHRVCRDGRWQDVQTVAEGAWLRDVAATDDGQGGLWVAAIDWRAQQDRIVVYHGDSAGVWQVDADLPASGYAARPVLCGLPDGTVLLVVERYEKRRYQLDVYCRGADGQWSQETTLDESGMWYHSATLACDAKGRVWLGCVRDLIVERSGVVSRAGSVRTWCRDAGRWHAVGSQAAGEDVLQLYEGLLPRTRYFGYDGLRRNPHLVAMSSGEVYLLAEMQRSEDENWDNLDNGYLVAVEYDGKQWDTPRLLRDGGCCFAVDSRVQHASVVPVVYKGEHRPDGNDYRVDRIRAADAPAFGLPDDSQWQGWQPLRMGGKPAGERATIDVQGTTYRLFFGDLHNHSVFSPDAEGWPDEFYHFARDIAGLDFLGLSENDYYPDKVYHSSESAYERCLVRRLEQPGQFIPFTGYERTFHQDDQDHTYNHRTVVFLGGEHRIIRRNEPAGQSDELFRHAIADHNVLVSPHHGQFTLLGIEHNIEVTSGWMVNMERTTATRDALAQGHKVGFIGGSDCHRNVPGLACAYAAIWAEELTREAIVDALRNRRCYATMGNRVVLDFRVNGQLMGSILESPASELAFTVQVASDVPLRRVTVVHNGQAWRELACNGTQASESWTIPYEVSRAGWYYVRVEQDREFVDHPHNVCQAIGHLAWSSPIWIEG